MATIQRIVAGVFKYGLSSQNRGRASIPGSVFVSIDANGNVTGDIRVHDGIRYGGISTPPPGTVSYMIPEKNTSNPLGFNTRDGWLFCDGSILDKIEYGALYDAIGDYWNKSPAVPSDKFQIPDFRGYFLRCYKSGRPFGYASREEDTVRKHSHYVILNEGGGHTHQYVNWEVNPAGTFTTPTSAAPLGVLADSSKPGYNTRAVYAIARPPADIQPYVIGDHTVTYDQDDSVGNTNPDVGWTNTLFEAAPSSPSEYIVMGESFTNPMNTTELHKHYMKTEIPNPTDMYEGSTSSFPDHEGVCYNVKIPTFIKY